MNNNSTVLQEKGESNIFNKNLRSPNENFQKQNKTIEIHEKPQQKTENYHISMDENPPNHFEDSCNDINEKVDQDFFNNISNLKNKKQFNLLKQKNGHIIEEISVNKIPTDKFQFGIQTVSQSVPGNSSNRKKTNFLEMAPFKNDYMYNTTNNLMESINWRATVGGHYDRSNRSPSFTNPLNVNPFSTNYNPNEISTTIKSTKKRGSPLVTPTNYITKFNNDVTNNKGQNSITTASIKSNDHINIFEEKHKEDLLRLNTDSSGYSYMEVKGHQ